MKTQTHSLAINANYFVMGLLSDEERLAFLETLAVSPAARAQLDAAETLAAEVAAQCPTQRPRRQVLDAALARIQARPAAAVRKPHVILRPNRWLARAAAAVVLGSGLVFVQNQHKTIQQLQTTLANQPPAIAIFPPGAEIVPNGGDAASVAISTPTSPSQAQKQLRTQPTSSTRLIAKPMVANNSGKSATLPAGTPHGSTGQGEGTNGVNSVFVEMRDPNEPASEKSTPQLNRLVENALSTAANQLAEAALPPKPTIIGPPAPYDSLELSQGTWELGNGVLYNEDSGLLMIPRGDGRTYDYRLPGPGFDAKDIAGTRQRYEEETRQQQIDATPEEIGLPRAYLYADSQSGDGFVVVKDLPPLAAGEVYRLYQDTATPELIGELPAQESGSNEATLQLPNPTAANAGFLLTTQPASTSPSQPGRVILRGR